jgi:hypothetical protein
MLWQFALLCWASYLLISGTIFFQDTAIQIDSSECFWYRVHHTSLTNLQGPSFKFFHHVLAFQVEISTKKRSCANLFEVNAISNKYYSRRNSKTEMWKNLREKFIVFGFVQFMDFIRR